MNWGSVSHDPVRGLLIANTNRLAFVVTLVPRERFYRTLATGRRPGRQFAPQRGTPYRTPMTYRAAHGKQFVVIAAGGHSALRMKMGDHVVAFTLP